MELELESPVSPEPEMEPESPAPPEPEMECVLVSKKAVALASKYEKNKGEDDALREKAEAKNGLEQYCYNARCVHY